MIYDSSMRIHLLLSSTCLLLLSCEPQTEISPESEKDQQASLSVISNRILEPDAPKLKLDSITQNSFIGNHFTYKRVFLESFENIEIPRLPPPGAGPEYIVKRDENDSGLIPVNKGRLRLRKDNTPYSGKVFRHYISGELEHYSMYKDGFRTGKAYWWRKDGNLSKLSEGWGFDYNEFPIDQAVENPIWELESEMRKYSTIDADSAIFCGTQDEWQKWSTMNSDGVRLSLHNGENLNGEVKIYTGDGFLESVRQYKDGLLDGEYSSYHTNGIQSRSINYSKGLKDGKEVWWSENGFKSYSANHSNGKIDGKVFSWDDRGYLVSENEFYQGNEVRPSNDPN